MTKRAIVFIDGNNLYHTLKDIDMKPFDLDFLKFSDFICAHFDVDRIHIMYYNSIPRMDDPAFFKNKKFFDGLEKQGIEIKTRKLQYKSSLEIKKTVLELIDEMKLCKKCNSIVLENLFKWIGNVIKKEKGIDVMIAVDVIRKTLGKECDYCIVVSGDADLIEAMKFAEIKGGKILSAFLDSGYSSEIKSKFKHFIIDRQTLMKNCLKDILIG